MMILAKVLMGGEYTCGGTNLVFSGTFPYLVSTIVLLIKIAVITIPIIAIKTNNIPFNSTI